jgi:hypothetical protein
MAKSTGERTGTMSRMTRMVLKKIQKISRRNNVPISFTAKDKLKPNAKSVGSTRQVATGFAVKTEGGLRQSDILAFRRNNKRVFVTKKAHQRSKETFNTMKNKVGLKMPWYKHNGRLVRPSMTYGQFISAPETNSEKAEIIKHYARA